MKKTLGCVRRADQDFRMIADGDRIAVGVSGGKDSMLLLYALHLYRMFSKKRYTLHALTVDLGFEGFDAQPIGTLCGGLDIPFTVVATRIGHVVFDVRGEKNPCALCSKLRKGAFYKAARALGLNKAALAHHREDVLDTFLLSLLYEGRLSTLSPAAFLSRSRMTVIRPFIYLSEKHILSAVRREGLPVVANTCPASGHTKREEMGRLLKELVGKYPKADEMMLSALKNTAAYNLWDKPYRGEGE